ncbi:MAG: HlyC/CorC family transporter [Ignavibacteriae bacterium]|nr:HlyC/CorC family transporter [Ignavibacteriota bacterium]
MLSQVVGNLIFILVLVLTNGFFVAAEFAIVKVRSSQIEHRVKHGHRRAILAKHIIQHLDAYLSATQLGITLASLGLGWVGEPLLADMFRGPFALLGLLSEQMIHAIAFIISFMILTFLHIIVGELGPKYLALQYPEETALLISFPLQLFYRFFRPLIWVLNRSSNVLLGLIGITPTRTSDLVHSPEELEIIVAEGAKSGALDKTEQELISRIFEFSDTTAHEIMVPRTEIIAVKNTTPREILIRIVTEEGYSRMPVYHESLDNIVGIIYTKDLISLLEHRDLIVLQDIIRPAHFVPESISIGKLMRDLQQRKMSMAIVVDEFGGTQGLITMEDILEEIVGEIHDEYDEILKDVEHTSDGSALVNARITIDNFNEKFGVELPEDEQYETLGGFLSKLTGHIPDINEEIRYDTLRFTVVKKSPRRIRQIRVHRIPQNAPSGGTA